MDINANSTGTPQWNWNIRRSLIYRPDDSNILKGICQISSGGHMAILVDMRILFALILNLFIAIIFCYNYPTGNYKRVKSISD
ncbi:hypothetical protein [Zunongwangia endophytica]|uniref:hypothetical protein n=1 Tax=Zunongwangia endophytica TaxID=1808945 RepID=UPI0025B495AE|nr:hypothetical protein [Zunongwangia endophytica]MDN3594416.1 hypothetical protein [Zunongwangia endophytica]